MIVFWKRPAVFADGHNVVVWPKGGVQGGPRPSGTVWTEQDPDEAAWTVIREGDDP